ncbi:MAG: ATP-binding protein [Gemmatimonadota bacterium]
MSRAPEPSDHPTTLPGLPRRGVASFRPLHAAALIAGAAILLAVLVRRSAISSDTVIIRQQVIQETIPSANALETAINRRMALLDGVAAFLAVNWGRPGLAQDFDAFGTRILKGVPGVRSIQYVVDGRITQTVPLAGNEAAVGRDILHDPRPEISVELRHALESDGVVLSGPIQLFQGGRGLIGRLAFRDAKGEVLGVAAVVLDVDPLLHESGFDNQQSLWMRLRDSSGAVIAGRPGLEQAGEVIRTEVHLPDRTWTLESVPAGGWDSRSTGPLFPFAVRVGLVVLLMALSAFLARSRQLARIEARDAQLRRGAEEKFARLFSLIPDGVILTRYADGRILEVNDVLVSMTGRPRDELIGRTTIEAGLWSSTEGREQLLAALAADRSISEFALALPTGDGHLRECRMSGRVVNFDGVDCLLMIIRDVHDQLQLERRLTEAARLEAVGRLAGGIAHDFNNLITAIAGYAQLLRERCHGDPEALRDLNEIVQSSDRAAELTRQLLAFARKQMVQPRVVDANTVIVGANSLLRRLVGEKITIATTIAPSPARVLIDPTQFEQVLTNLAVNARDAMPNGGTLHIQTTVEGNTVIVTVSDTGTGVAPDVREHIFEPFFTTKAAGQGTGLGLATCYGIIQQAGGRIEVTSRLGEWTTFRIALPLAPGAPDPAPPSRDEHEAPRGTETILVAEDEPQIRRLAERVLKQLGYTVLVAVDGNEALALASAHNGTLQLLLTDMVMPGMGGGELARRIHETRPETRLLLMSGYSEELVAAEYGGAPFLAKPFSPAELADAVREALDGRS